MNITLRLAFWFFIVGLVFGAPVTKPSDDDFYQAPEGFEKEELGSILKFRVTPYQLKSIYFPVNVQNSWQMLVRSEDVFGNATAVMATIFQPHNGNSSKLVAYQTAEDASNINCSPSYAYSGSGGLGTLEERVEMFNIQTILDQGYYVVSPDYEGAASVFTVGTTSGIATLNCIRAALKTQNATTIHPDAKVVMWGYSGGTIASGWAAGLAPSYAEDLSDSLIGAALGGWVTNITSTAEATDGSLFAGLIPNAIAGLTNQYPELMEFVKTGQIAAGRFDDFARAYNSCLINSIFDFAYAHIFAGQDPYAIHGWELMSNPAVVKVLTPNTLGINATKDVFPEIPLFVYHGVKDEIVPFKDAQRVYEVWCDQGIGSLEFAVSKSTGHILEFIEGIGAAVSWINRVFDNDNIVEGCHRTERETNLLYPGGLSGTSEWLGAIVRNILGEPIGDVYRKRQEMEEDTLPGDFELESLMKIMIGDF